MRYSYRVTNFMLRKIFSYWFGFWHWIGIQEDWFLGWLEYKRWWPF